MKKILFAFLLLSPIPLNAQPIESTKETTCNLRYNNLGIIAGDIPCKAQFTRQGNLKKVSFFYPKTRSTYDWSVNGREISRDPRWRECIRYTFPEGNQWQVCTVPSPEQLGFSKR